MEDKRSEILLESGTNELQILEFKMADQLFGINVAKVSEIQVAVPTTPMQNLRRRRGRGHCNCRIQRAADHNSRL